MEFLRYIKVRVRIHILFKQLHFWVEPQSCLIQLLGLLNYEPLVSYKRVSFKKGCLINKIVLQQNEYTKRMSSSRISI